MLRQGREHAIIRPRNRDKAGEEIFMNMFWIGRAVAACSFAALVGCAQSEAPIALRDMGSFHIGGREVTITGKPTKEVTYTPGGVAAKVDPNGIYQADQM